MPSEIITGDDGRIKSFFNALDSMASGLERLAKNHKPALSGERYLIDREVSVRLKVSRRTLQDWRTNGQIAYTMLGGKALYRESDIQKMLEAGYRKPFGWITPVKSPLTPLKTKTHSAPRRRVGIYLQPVTNCHGFNSFGQ